jgi:hypothetical protein
MLAISSGAIIGPVAFLLALVIVFGYRGHDEMRDMARRDRKRARR